MNEPTHLDLFSGIGGFALAAQWAGFRTIGFCEIEPYAQKILEARFGAVADADNGLREQPQRQIQAGWHEPDSRPALHRDIRQLNGADYAGVDLITGGFPCQPFSVAGERRGKEDDRHLWPEMVRVIEQARPTWVVGENVAGIIQMELDQVLSDLEGIGYTVWPLVIPAVSVDAPHIRSRVWVLAHSLPEGRGYTRGAEGQRAAGSRTLDESSRTGCGCEDVAKASNTGRQQQRRPEPDGAQHQAYECGSGWLPEPDVGRVAHGVSSRVDRLRSLGNAIVPSVAYEILRGIKQS